MCIQSQFFGEGNQMFPCFFYRRLCDVRTDKDLQVLHLKADEHPIKKIRTRTGKIGVETRYLPCQPIDELPLQVYDSTKLSVREDCPGKVGKVPDAAQPFKS